MGFLLPPLLLGVHCFWGFQKFQKTHLYTKRALPQMDPPPVFVLDLASVSSAVSPSLTAHILPSPQDPFPKAACHWSLPQCPQLKATPIFIALSSQKVAVFPAMESPSQSVFRHNPEAQSGLNQVEPWTFWAQEDPQDMHFNSVLSQRRQLKPKKEKWLAQDHKHCRMLLWDVGSRTGEAKRGWIHS